MSHYTDTDVQAAAWALRSELNLSIIAASHIARIVLDATAPTIEARGLLHAADALAKAEPSPTFAAGWMAAEMGLRARARKGQS